MCSDFFKRERMNCDCGEGPLRGSGRESQGQDRGHGKPQKLRGLLTGSGGSHTSSDELAPAIDVLVRPPRTDVNAAFGVRLLDV